MDNQPGPSGVNTRISEDEKFHGINQSVATDSALPIASSHLNDIESSNTKGFPVRNRSGVASDEGVLYENLMFLWVLLTLLEDNRVERFHIAQNIKEVGAFDDLVFRVKYTPLGEEKSLTKLFLIQLKYKMNKPVSKDSLTTAAEKGDFSLLKYYKAFNLINSMVINGTKFENIFLNDCEIDNMIFVIYTNAYCGFWDDNYPKDSLCRDLLQTNNKKNSNVFSFNDVQQNEEFYKKLQENGIPVKEGSGQKFFDRLVLFTSQGTPGYLQEIVKTKLEKYSMKKDNSLDEILYRAIDFIKRNNKRWMSLHSGVLFNVTIFFQGFPVNLNDMREHWKLKPDSEIYRKIIVQHILQKKGCLVSVGKIVKPSQEYYIERKVESDIIDTNISDEQFVILSAPPGMGKSDFFTQKAYEIKKSNPFKYIIRETLLNHTDYLDQTAKSSQTNTEDGTDKNKSLAEDFLKQLAGVKLGIVDYDVFRCCLEGDNNMVIFLDGVDEINPHYFEKVCHIIQVIRAEFRVQLWVSTRTILNAQMKEYFEIEFWTLTEFTTDEAKQFLNKYCGEKFCSLDETEQKLCVIPLFCKMLGDIRNGSNLEHAVDVIKSKADLYDKFIEVKFQVYYEKNKVNTTAPSIKIEMETNRKKEMKRFEIAAVLVIFGKDKISELKWNMKTKCKDVLDTLNEGIEYMGIITKMEDGKPVFIHQSFAEYFCGMWFIRNTKRYKEYIEHPGNTPYTFPEEVDYFMSSKLNNTNSLYSLVLNKERENEIESSLDNYTDKFNMLDPLGRDVLHYANLVNNYKALKYILFNGYNIAEECVADLNTYRPVIISIIAAKLVLSWLSAKLKKYPEYGPLLGLILLRSHLREYTRYFLIEHSKNSPLHTAILNQCKEDIKLEEENQNSKDELGLTALHVAAWMEDIDTIKLLGENRAEYRNDNLLGIYPHQFVTYHNKEIYNFLKQCCNNFMKEDVLTAEIMSEDYILQDLPLHYAVQKKKLRKYLQSISDLNSIKIDSKGHSVLHVAAASSCKEVFGGSLERVYIKYTMDDCGYYPHHYAKNTLMHTWLKNRGIHSIYNCLELKDTGIKGLWFTDILNKVVPTPDEEIELGDTLGLLMDMLVYSVRLKLLNEDTPDRSTTAQNLVEFSVLYDVIFRSKYRPPGQDKRLYKQYAALKNNMIRKYNLETEKLSLDSQRSLHMKINYLYTFLENDSGQFQHHLKQNTLEEIALIMHTHVELMSEDNDHLQNCSCLEVQENEK